MIYLLENYIINIIKENETFKKELHVFDFDMTLYNPYENEWIENVVKEAKKQIKNENSITALCTARTKNKQTVISTIDLLKSKDLKFDYYAFKPLKINISTPEYKSKAVSSIINKIEGLDLICFWDDRQDNLNSVGIVSSNYNIEYNPIKT